MKKNFSLLFCLGLSTMLTIGCSEQKSGGSNQNDNQYSVILKDCGTKIMGVANEKSSQSTNRGFSPYDNAPAQAIAMPGVYLYWSGLLNEIDGVNIVEHAIRFSGKYRFNGDENPYVQSITFDLSVHFDEENNNFTFLGKQDLPTNPVTYSYLILNCNYNFTTKELGSFSILMQQASFDSGNYIRYINGNLELFNFGSNDGHETDPDYIEYSAIARNGIETLTELMATEEVLEGDKLQSAIDAFVNASDYCDEVCEGTNFNVEVVTE